MFVGYAEDHTKDVYRFLNIHTKRIILSRDVRWLNIIWKRYKDKSIFAKRQAELFLDEEESSIEGELYFEDLKDKSNKDGNNTDIQKKLGIDINMIGAREETLGKTRSEAKELSSPTNESMERADLTMGDWIQETCFISAVTSEPSEPKTFQEAWHSPVKEERKNWQNAIRKEIRSMINGGVWRKVDKKNIPSNRRLIGNKCLFKIKRDGTYRARLVALGYSQIPGVDYTDNFAPVAHDVSFRMALSEVVKELKFIVQLLQTMNIEVKLPITVYVDNVGAIWSSNNRTTSDRTKHIDIRTAFVKEYQEDGKITIKFVKSEENEADIFTKNTTKVIFSNHQKKLVWDKENVESELIQELDQSENQQEGC